MVTFSHTQCNNSSVALCHFLTHFSLHMDLSTVFHEDEKKNYLVPHIPASTLGTSLGYCHGNKESFLIFSVETSKFNVV